jgi:hypothetical protein
MNWPTINNLTTHPSTPSALESDPASGAELWYQRGWGELPFDTSLPEFPLLDGPKPPGAIRGSSSST